MVKKCPPCPQCHRKKVLPIVYGMPSMKAVEEEKAGKYVLGGCCTNDDSPKWHCQDCGHEFGKYFEISDLTDPPEVC